MGNPIIASSVRTPTESNTTKLSLTTAASIATINSVVDSANPTTAGSQVTAVDQLQLSTNTAPSTQNSATAPMTDRNDRHNAFLESNPFAVRLKSFLNKDVVAFRVSPDISETRTASYKALDPIHLPGSIQIYTNTGPRTWSMSGIKLVSRNGYEAEENLATVNQLRSWMVPFFGETDTTNGRGGYSADLLGSPPEVLQFSAYSNLTDKTKTNIRNIPVVMTSLSIPYPTDVDYIQTVETNQPFPSVMSIDILLMETHSPREFSQFDLIDFRQGTLLGF